MNFRLFNTESRSLETVEGAHILMYTCGPTIYDFAHIGNFRTYVFEDLLRRTLKFLGHSITQVMNITDVDDKTIRGAIAKNLTLKEYTEPFRVAFFEDLKNLNIEAVEYYPAATDYIQEMIQLIEQLIQKGFAYRSQNGSIYFSIRKAPRYGRLSHLCLEELKVNASGENEADEYEKESVSDFVLWKAYDAVRDGKIFWESPFGPGRPGWHIECSAMAMKLLGPTIDIHCGGVDNMFPHHENEIVQSESCSGALFVRHWVHVEHLLVDHKKMSKSLGNFYTLRDLLRRGYRGEHVRYLLLSSHYRTQLNFTTQGLDAARVSLQRIWDFVSRMRSIDQKGAKGVESLLVRADQEFRQALCDDMNISSALAVLFDLVRELNGWCDRGALSKIDADLVLALFKSWDRVLGISLIQEEGAAPSDVLDLLQQRERARKDRDYALSDQIRDEITKRGYLIEDTPQGVRLKRK